jgi:hypothetical protein
VARRAQMTTWLLLPLACAFSCAHQPSHPCLSVVACPKPPTRIDCSAAGRVWTVREVFAQRGALLEQEIYVKGLLDRNYYAGTTFDCKPGACCNRLDAPLKLRIPNTCLDRDARVPGHCMDENEYRASVKFDDLGCVGDDSKRCCPFDPGQEVVVRGILHGKWFSGADLPPEAASHAGWYWYHLSSVAMCAGSG